MKKKREKHFSDFPNVDQQRNQLIPEEFPEGPFGSANNNYEKVSSKSEPWGEGQYRTSAFTFPDKNQHAGIPRQVDGSHPTHDESELEDNER